MPRIKAICVSDLHLGSETSVLTAIDPKSLGPDINKVSPVLESFVECLKVILRSHEGIEKPRLVLAGDVLEFALTTDNVAATVFTQFAKLLFDKPGLPIDPSLIYVPGNHDHHLWETARESQYVSYLNEPKTSIPLTNIPWHATHLFAWGADKTVANRDVDSCLLTTLLKLVNPGTDAHVLAMYPDFGVLSANDKSRCAIVHHGHFTESIYYLMTELGKVVFPSRNHPDEIWDIETENYAWIDFLWGTLGRSGEIGKDVGTVYNMLKSDEATRRLIRNIAESILQRLKRPRRTRWYEGPISRYVLNLLMKRVSGLERSVPDEDLSADSRKLLNQYIAQYVRGQLKRECKNGLPGQLTFVFGHTHKPYEDVYRIDGVERPVNIYNTGGWIVDTTEPVPKQGAAIVVIDEDGYAASIRMYNQSANPSSYRVRVAKAGEDSEPNPLYDELCKLVDSERTPWLHFSATVAEAVKERCGNMGKVIQRAGK